MPNPENLEPIKDTETAKRLGAKGGKAKKGSKHISTHIKEMLNDEKLEIKLENGQLIEGRPIKAIIQAAIIKAAQGDVRAFDILAKRGWGDKLDITSGDQPIKTALVKFIDGPDEDTDTE